MCYALCTKEYSAIKDLPAFLYIDGTATKIVIYCLQNNDLVEKGPNFLIINELW